MNDPGAALLLALIFRFSLYLILVSIGFVVLYFIIRAALNKSNMNENIEQLRNEIIKMNDELQSIKKSLEITKDRDH